jgi:TPR repeat protein
MKLSIKSLLATLVVFLSLIAPGLAGPYEDAMAARSRGDYAKAAVFIHKATEQSHAQAQYSLGVAYAEGMGVPQDNAQAVRWCRKAATSTASSI